MDLETLALKGLETDASAPDTAAANAAAAAPDIGSKAGSSATDKPVKEPPKPADTEDDTEDDTATEPPPPPAAPETEIKDDAKVKMGDQEVTIADLKGGYMRLTDYRQKTAEVARERNAIKAERETFDSERGQWKEYLRALFNNPEFLADQLEDYGPETLEKLLESRADDLIKRDAMDERSRKLYDDTRRRARELRKRERAIEAEERKRQANEGKTKQEQLTARYTKTIPDAMRAAGLVIDGDNDHNRHMARLLQGELMASHGSTEYSDEQIREAALAVADHPAAKALLREKKSIPADIETLVKTLGPDKVKAILKHEAGKSSLARPPAAFTIKPGNSKKADKKARVSLGSFFDSIRDEFGE